MQHVESGGDQATVHRWESLAVSLIRLFVILLLVYVDANKKADKNVIVVPRFFKFCLSLLLIPAALVGRPDSFSVSSHLIKRGWWNGLQAVSSTDLPIYQSQTIHMKSTRDKVHGLTVFRLLSRLFLLWSSLREPIAFACELEANPTTFSLFLNQSE